MPGGTNTRRMGLQVVQPGRVEGEHLLSLLKVPSALAGRMAVAEASLQRLHGSPDALQPGRAGAGTGSGPAAQQLTSLLAPKACSAMQIWAEEKRQAANKARPTSRCDFSPQERAARCHSVPLRPQQWRLSRGAVPP